MRFCVFAIILLFLGLSEAYASTSIPTPSDLGILEFIALPLQSALIFAASNIGNLAISIVAVTFILKLLMLPLQYLSLKSTKALRSIQPEVNRIKSEIKDPLKQHQALRNLMREKGVHPLAGIAPLAIQAPLFIAFFQVVLNIEQRIGTESFLWLSSLSATDPLFILPALTGLALFIQLSLQKTEAIDYQNTQKTMRLVLPAMTTVIGTMMPAGVAIYILTSTVFQAVSQLVLEKTL